MKIILLPTVTSDHFSWVLATIRHHLLSSTMSDAETFNTVNQKITACEKLIDDVVHRLSPLDKFASNLKDIVVSLEEAQDYVLQLEQRIQQQGEHGSEGLSMQPSQSGTAIHNATSSMRCSQTRNGSSHLS